MRIDKLLSEMGICSRTEASAAARGGGISVDGKVVRRADIHIDPNVNKVNFMGEELTYKPYVYVMLNKPAGYVSATDDPRERTVLELLDDRRRRLNLFPCGRLDKNTLGLLILTNDGNLSHRLLSPKHHVTKKYYFRSERKVTDEDAERLRSGINLDGIVTKPTELTLEEDRQSGFITLTEGKYHQIKRMFEAVCNKIIYLERIEFAGIGLDPKLERGCWRELTPAEEELLRSHK